MHSVRPPFFPNDVISLYYSFPIFDRNIKAHWQFACFGLQSKLGLDPSVFIWTAQAEVKHMFKSLFPVHVQLEKRTRKDLDTRSQALTYFTLKGTGCKLQRGLDFYLISSSSSSSSFLPLVKEVFCVRIILTLKETVGTFSTLLLLI